MNTFIQFPMFWRVNRSSWAPVCQIISSSNLWPGGWIEAQIIENYLSLSPDALHAVFAFTAECMREEAFYTLPAKAG